MIGNSLVRMLTTGALAAFSLAFATPAAADQSCDANVSIAQAVLGEILPDSPDTAALDSVLFPQAPGSACSNNSECRQPLELCEGGSCCVREGMPCEGLGYCCGHPSQGCVNGRCPILSELVPPSTDSGGTTDSGSTSSCPRARLCPQ